MVAYLPNICEIVSGIMSALKGRVPMNEAAYEQIYFPANREMGSGMQMSVPCWSVEWQKTIPIGSMLSFISCISGRVGKARAGRRIRLFILYFSAVSLVFRG